MYNIWHNKYCDTYRDEPYKIEIKTEKKINDLKAKMVQKLIFEPLILYAKLKASKTHTIDEWFKPADVSVNSVDSVDINTGVSVNSILNKNKKPEKHDIKVKKTKQLSLDAFF